MRARARISAVSIFIFFLTIVVLSFANLAVAQLGHPPKGVPRIVVKLRAPLAQAVEAELPLDQMALEPGTAKTARVQAFLSHKLLRLFAAALPPGRAGFAPASRRRKFRAPTCCSSPTSLTRKSRARSIGYGLTATWNSPSAMA